MNEEILVKYMVGESNAEEQQSVEQWLAEDPAHRRHYQQFLEVWKLSHHAAVPAPRDEHAAWERFKGRLAEKRRSEKPVRTFGGRWIRIAATICLCLSIGVAVYILQTPEGSFVGRDIAANSSVLRDTLADGTVVTLNKGSSIHVAPTALKGRRRVTVGAGEVFFHVARNENKPFEVAVGDVRVTVLGTSFHVKREGRKIVVIVSTGLVRVQYGEFFRELTPGQRVVIDQDDSTFALDTVAGQLYQYYVNDQFVLKNTPLKEVVDVLSDAYGEAINIERQEVGELTLTATFERDSLEDILEVIAETLDVTVIKEKNTWVIK